NEAAFHAVTVRPRAMTDVSVCDTRATLLGSALDAPLGVAPTAYQRLVHPEGEIAMARGAGAAGALMVVSIFASCALEDIAAAAARLESAHQADSGVSAVATHAALTHDPSLTWADLAWLRERTALPIVLKGILTADDAALAVTHGADAIVVSNHGGRQLDAAPA